MVCGVQPGQGCLGSQQEQVGSRAHSEGTANASSEPVLQ